MKHTRSTLINDIEADIGKYHKLIQGEFTHTLENQALELLGNIEERVFQIIGSQKQRTAIEKERIFQRYLILNHLSVNYESMNQFLDILIARLTEILRKRNIPLKYDIFQRGTLETLGDGGNNEKVGKIQTVKKIQILERVLYNLGISFDQVQCFDERLDETRMRKIPYTIYHIHHGELKKTILICDQVGQATFVYDDIILPEKYRSIEKGESIDGVLPLRIIYGKGSFEAHLQIALGNGDIHDRETQIKNPEKEEVNITKEKLSKEELLQKLWNYKGSIQESYEYFMELRQGNKDTPDSLRGLKIDGKGVYEMRTVSDIEIQRNIWTPSGFQEWINGVFRGTGVEIREVLNKERLLQILWSYKGSIQESYEYFMRLQKGNKDTPDSINGLKIDGKGVYELQTISDLEIQGNIWNPSGFKEWINGVFRGTGVEIREVLNKEKLLQILWSYKGSIQESYKYFMEFQRGNKNTPDSISGFKIQGKGVQELQTISGIEIQENVRNPSVFQEWINGVFRGTGVEIIEALHNERLMKILWSYKGSIQESYEYFMRLQKGNKDTPDSINGLKIQGKGVTELRTISEIEIQGNIYAPSGFQEWINGVFRGTGVEIREVLNKEKLLQILWNYKGSIQESYEYFMNLKQGNKDTPDSISGLKINGAGVRNLQNISEIEIQERIHNSSGFQEWINEIFRELIQAGTVRKI